jgi:chemotaxis signal transduction protein/hemoglobin-like flavoprotein
VREIIPIPEITPLPKSPVNLIGVINVRSVVIPVADLRACLGFQPQPVTADTRIVLVKHHNETLGLIVDAVSEVVTLSADALESMRDSHGDSRFLRAVARFQDRLVLEIDHTRAVDEGLNMPVPSARQDDPPAAAEAASLQLERAHDIAADDGELRVDLIEESFKLVAQQADLTAERFYQRLFEAAPSVRSMFPDDMADQKRALIAALGTIVGHLRRPEMLEAYVSGLGERHAGYGARPEHYELVGATLLDTLAEVVGEAWGDAYASAWSQAFATTRDIMLAAADAVPVSKAPAKRAA